MTDKWVALFALATAVGCAIAEMWPTAAVALFVTLAVGLVVVIVARERGKGAEAIEDWCDSDSHLADAAHADDCA